VLARDWCGKHYERWRQHGSPDDPRPSLEERFWSKVDKDGPGGCWLWTGARSSEGYGTIWVDGKMVLAHRLAYQLYVGPIPEDRELDHRCRVRHCVNYERDLEPVTGQENCRRGEGFWSETCRKGHPRTATNTYQRRDGGRSCLDCRRERRRLGAK
jgi:hypothetical protein